MRLQSYDYVLQFSFSSRIVIKISYGSLNEKIKGQSLRDKLLQFERRLGLYEE